MPAAYLCGIDVGTTNTKATLISDDGAVLAEASEPSRINQRGPGWVEQDPDEMAAAAERVLGECVRQAGVDPARVAGIAITGQMAGVASVDADWNPVTPYDSWLDTRCDPYVAVMRRRADSIIAASGGPPTYSHGPKMLWWKHEYPEIFRRIHKFVMPAAYVAGRLADLTGDQAFIDPTYLHFSCLADIRAQAWSEELCSHFEIPMEKLPRIVEPSDVVGRLSREAAARVGLVSGIPIVAGAGDQSAAMLGAGVIRPGIGYDAAGTASSFALCVPGFSPDVAHKTLVTGRLPAPGLWYALGYINGGGLNLRWLRDMLRALPAGGSSCGGMGLDYAQLDDLASRVPPGSDGLVFVPHLGGRVCPNQPNVRGAWVGLRWSHSTGHLYRALLESVAYEYSIYLDIEQRLAPDVAFHEVRVVGGGSQSALWNQLKADVLGVPYTRLNRSEAGSLGAAILAGYGIGVFRDLEAAVSAFVHPVERFEPRPEKRELYRPFAAFYRNLLEEYAGLWEGVASLSLSR
ncbi:MAG: FGGY family carbohydrate kinase [Bacillota bacterium]